MNNPRVFVSSVMDNFAQYREATRVGILAAGGIPILVEDYPSLEISSRTACLDGIASSDILVVVVGSRGGWIAPSGKLVVEEEYEEALRRKIPVIPFIQLVDDRDNKAQALVGRLSDYVEGHFRTTFRDAEELKTLVATSLKQIIEHKKAPMTDTTLFHKLLSEVTKMDNEVVLRFILMPERKDQLIDSVEIASDKFGRDILALAHSAEVNLLSYEVAKVVDVGITEIAIKQKGTTARRQIRDEIAITLTSMGTIIVDANVTGRKIHSSNEQHTLTSLFFLQDSDVTDRLAPCFAFANGFYQLRDPFKRYDRYLYNVVLHNIGQRMLVEQIPNSTSITVPRAISEPVVAFDNPQILSRGELSNFQTQLQAVLSLFHRRIKPRDIFGNPL